MPKQVIFPVTSIGLTNDRIYGKLFFPSTCTMIEFE